jgi:hypothetical protein
MPPKSNKKEVDKVEVTIQEEEIIVKEEILVQKEINDEVADDSVNGENDDSSNTHENSNIISHIEYISYLSEATEITKRLTLGQKSIVNYTKPELREIDKAVRLLQKAKEQLSKEENKTLFSLAASSAPRVKKVNKDSNGVKITIGKNPVNFLPFAQTFFELPSMEGHGSRYLEYMWANIKKEDGVKDGSLIIINKPGSLNTFFNGIKNVMEERGLKTDKEKEVYALLEKGELKNTDITKFSKYCYEEKEKKPNATKKITKKVIEEVEQESE